MAPRRDVADLLTREGDGFRRGARELLARHDRDADALAALDREWAALAAEIPGLPAESLAAHERPLVRRARALAPLPVAVTLAGPTYQDNPIRYAGPRFTDLTGYSLAEVRGENLRLLQGPDTEAGPVDALREALDIWEPVTVDLCNYRADGERFRNRVSLVPVSGADGTVTNWFGLQAGVEG